MNCRDLFFIALYVIWMVISKLSRAMPVALSNCNEETDVIFVLDGSGSIRSESFTIAKEWIVNVTDTLDIESGKDRVGVIQYSHWFPERKIQDQIYIVTEVSLRSAYSVSKLKEKITNIRQQEFSTYTAHALEKARYDFTHYGRTGVRKVMVLLTDGKASDSSLLEMNAQALRNDGVLTFAVGVGAADQDELRIVATGDTNSNERVFELSNFNDLQSLVTAIGEDIKCKRQDSGMKSHIPPSEKVTVADATPEPDFGTTASYAHYTLYDVQNTTNSSETGDATGTTTSTGTGSSRTSTSGGGTDNSGSVRCSSNCGWFGGNFNFNQMPPIIIITQECFQNIVQLFQGMFTKMVNFDFDQKSVQPILKMNPL